MNQYCSLLVLGSPLYAISQIISAKLKDIMGKLVSLKLNGKCWNNYTSKQKQNKYFEKIEK